MASVHASCIQLDGKGVLIRGPSGTGKSRLALALIDAAIIRGRSALLVADDRVLLDIQHNHLMARAPESLAGLIERWGLGVERVPYVPMATVALIVDIVDRSALQRMPEKADRHVEIAGLVVPRIAVSDDMSFSLPIILAALR